MSFELTGEILQALEEHFPSIVECVDPPVLTMRDGHPVYRYEEQAVEQALVQKGARVISGLNASFVLLQSGHLQELRAIYRMLDEFGEDIVFLCDIIATGKSTELQEQYLTDFWAEEFDIDGKPFQSSQKRKTVSRSKIHAAIVRQKNYEVNPSDGQEIHRTTARAYSGYVHAASPHIMEMYGGAPAKFHIGGMLGTPPFSFAKGEALTYFYRGLLSVTFVAFYLGCSDAAESLRAIKSRVEEITGVGHDDVAAIIGELKK